MLGRFRWEVYSMAVAKGVRSWCASEGSHAAHGDKTLLLGQLLLHFQRTADILHKDNGTIVIRKRLALDQHVA